MVNFTFHTPTKVFFGKDTHLQIGDIICGYGFKKILLHYGQGSVKSSGLYDEIIASLNTCRLEVTELAGAEPNPKLSLVKRGAVLCRETGTELILAVGGGSVIDSAKAMAVATLTDDDPWLFFEKKAVPSAALPVGVVLTLSASGSETSASCVITNEDKALKRGMGNPLNRPLFAVMNPELTYTVDRFQTGCGITDIMMHTLERYFSQPAETDLTDRLAEALLKSVILSGSAAIANPRDYESRATLMWAGSLSHNDLTGAGKDVFLTCHQLEHELSGMYDHVAHGAGLSVIFPAWCKYVYRRNIPKFCQYAVRVWNIEMDFISPERTALAGIFATEDYFKSIGMPTRLRELSVPGDRIEELSEKCTYWGTRTLPGFYPLEKAEIIDIFKLCDIG